MAKLLSGKVGVQTYAGLSTSRNQIVGGQPSFIGLNEVEPNLGLSPQNSYVLYGDANGTRRWGEPSGAPSGSVSGITIRDEGLNPVGLAGSVTIIDIVGDGVVAIQTHITQGGVQVGLATLTIPANNLDGEDARGFTQVTGISTIRVGLGLSIFAPSGTTGIASIRSLTQVGVDVYDPASYLTVSEASQIIVGTGLSVTQPQVNRAKIEFEGIIPRLEVTGISTFNQTSLSDANVTGIVTATGGVIGNLTGNVVGNVTGDLNGNVTGNVTGNLTGDVYAGLATATKGFTGNINATGVSTITQLLVGTINNTGFETAFGYISNGNSFMGNLNSGGISTTKYLSNTNINSTGIITATSFVGPVTGNVSGNITGNTNGTHTGAVSGNVTGNLNGNVTGNVTGDLTGDFLAGLSTVTNELHIKSDDGTPGRINYYCETGNAHYSQVKAAPHSEYSGNVTAILPVKSGDFIVGDTEGAISQNIITSGIITATTFVGAGQNLTDVSAASVLVTATDTTNATHYMVFSDSVSGQETMRTDNSLTYNPSTNQLSVSGPIDVSDITCHNITPELNNTYNLGTNTQRFANIYSADLQLSNVNAHPNSVDGTKGDWTLQEGESDIFMINNITGKKFKINLTEV
tara:strand:- start:3220 stop:5115 length:1896 start_codon:yes stop_codon:yes gene_type:complete